MIKTRQGFTLIELVAVLVVLGIILAIAVPTITGIIKGSSMKAFESDAKMVLKGIDYKKLQDEGFDPTSVNKENIYNLLGISNANYEDVMITVDEETPIISIIGTDKWDGFIACGTFQNMKVVENASDCNVDAIPPVINILGDNPVNMYVGETYSDAGATAMDNISGNVTNDIIVTGSVNPNAPGSYTITYRVQDIFENESVATRTINVIDNAYPMITFNPNGNATYAKSYSTTITTTDLGIIDDSSLKYVWNTSTVEPSSGSFANTYTSGENISTPASVTGTYYLWAQASDTVGNRTATRSNVFNLDNTKPVITINGSNPVTLNKGSTYTDAGATAIDNIDGSISVTTTGSVNPSVVGSYTITYNATDSSGNIAASVTRTINVVDISAPVITLNGSNPANINVGSAYTDAGATAIDDVDGNVTSRISITGSVNPNVVGTYTITYMVKDNANNTATATRTVNVIDNILPTVAFGTNGNGTYAKTRSTTVTVSDAHTGVNTSNLKYQWTTSTTTPSEASFTATFTNGGTLTSPASVTGGYYLWILAKDNAGNTLISRTNVFNLDNTASVITMIGSTPININVGGTYTDAGSTATDAHSGISGSVTATGTVNPSVAGTYTITYNVSDNAGNAATPVSRTINVIDNVLPTVVFGTNGNSTYAKTRSTTVTVSDAHTGVNTSSLKYQWTTSTTAPTEASFSVSFTNGGTITSPVSVTGGYYLWILAKDTSGNTLISKTNVFNLDNTVPVITMTGSTPINIIVGSAYTDAGATATDAHSGISGSVASTGVVNTNVAGTYTITYNVNDNAGNSAIAVIRTVNVIQSIYAFNYTGGVQNFTVPATGNYKLEVYGAQGGRINGGKGGYSTGTVSLSYNQTLYIYVGGAGSVGPEAWPSYVQGGWNGGGNCYCSVDLGAGGGATDIRLNSTNLTNRIIVAGGGGGGSSMGNSNGGTGGGLTGGDTSYKDYDGTNYNAYGGTQTAGGEVGGILGSGGSTSNIHNSGGGGGYYGGGVVTVTGNIYAGAGGGSGYIGGVTNGSMSNGVRSGDGYVIITYLGQ